MLSHLAAAVSRDRALEAATAPAAATLDDGRGEQGEAGRQRAGASAGGEKLGTRGGGEVERGGVAQANASRPTEGRLVCDGLQRLRLQRSRMAFDRMAPTFFSVTLSASMASRLAASASRYSARSEPETVRSAEPAATERLVQRQSQRLARASIQFLLKSFQTQFFYFLREVKKLFWCFSLLSVF